MRALILLPLFLAACAAGPDDDEVRRWEAELDRLPPRPAAAPADLSGELDLDAVVRAARAGNPELRELSARARSEVHAARRDGSLDDPFLRVRTERGFTGSDRADENGLGLEQRIPFPGNLGRAEEAGLRGAAAATAAALARERDVVARVKRTYYDLYAARKELETHLEHIRLLEELEQVSESRFRTGVVSQQDVLKPQVEIVLLQTDVLSARQRIASAQAALNALLGRPAAAPLGAPKDPALEAAEPGVLDELLRAAESHPELRSRAEQARAAWTRLELARREAVLPDFTLGAEYMQMAGERDAWAAMAGINLPWFTGRRRAEARRLEEALNAEEAAVESARLTLHAEVRDAHARAEAAGRALTLLRDELLPKTIQTVDVARAAYQQGRLTFLELLDAERSLRDARLRFYQAQSMLGSALADLERSSGRNP